MPACSGVVMSSSSARRHAVRCRSEPTDHRRRSTVDNDRRPSTTDDRDSKIPCTSTPPPRLYEDRPTDDRRQHGRASCSNAHQVYRLPGSTHVPTLQKKKNHICKKIYIHFRFRSSEDQHVRRIELAYVRQARAVYEPIRAPTRTSAQRHPLPTPPPPPPTSARQPPIADGGTIKR